MFESFKYNELHGKREGNEYGPDNGSQEKLLGEHANSQKPKKERRREKTSFAVAGCTILTNIFWSMTLALGSFHPNSDIGPNLIHSPARDVISYEAITTHSTIDSMNMFKGQPRPEQDAAWKDNYLRCNYYISNNEPFETDILQGLISSFLPRTLKAINRTSIELTDDSGYLGTLSVFHQIHCLDYIRQYIFRDHYPSSELPARRWQHVDHCIDEIRLSLMCHGDISLTTWGWEDTEATPFANFNVKHECRNWDSILEWTKARQADPAAIVRPLNELSYSEYAHKHIQSSHVRA